MFRIHAIATVVLLLVGGTNSHAQLCGIDFDCDTPWPLPNAGYFSFNGFSSGGDLENGVAGEPDAIWQGEVGENRLVAGFLGGASQTNDEDGGVDEHYLVDLPALNGASGLTIALWFNQNVALNDNSLRSGLFNSRDLSWTLDGTSDSGGLWGVSLAGNGFNKGLDGRINTSQAHDVATANPGTGILPSGTLADGSTYEGIPAEGAWHHVALTWDGQTGTQRLYFDGALLGEGIDSRNVGTIDNSVGWRIGDDPCCVSREFTGTLDDLGVWDTPLDEDEIEAIYQFGLQGVELMPGFEGPPPPVSFTAIQSNFFTEFGATRADGDLNGDGAVDWPDYRLWKDAFPSDQAVLAVSVPEPSSTGLLLLACFGQVARRAGVRSADRCDDHVA